MAFERVVSACDLVAIRIATPASVSNCSDRALGVTGAKYEACKLTTKRYAQTGREIFYEEVRS